MAKTEAIDSKLSDNALAILEKRYFRKDADGNIIEDWHGLCTRVAKFIASAEEEEDRESWAAEFYYMMHQLTFLPNSPTLFNADMPLGNLSACFVLPIEDSLESIFETLGDAAIIFATGGGCGYDFSALRKRGSPVSRTSGVSSGPVSFIHVYNESTDVIKQGGKRRGANMGVLRVDHPDIEEFIDSKAEEGALSNFNLSVAVTDKFMRAVATARREGMLTGDEFELYDRYADKVDRTVSATELFDKIVHHAWSNGEPGILFIDEINRRHPLDGLGDISGVNPCVSKGTLISTSRGLVPIETVEKGDQVLTRDGKFAVVLRQINNGVRPVVELKTRRGFRIKVTPDHKMWTPEGWISADQCLDKRLVLQQSESFGTQNMDENLAELLGFWFGDGSSGDRVQFAFGHDEFLAQKYRDILNSQFGCKVNITIGRGNNLVPNFRVVTGKRNAVEFFRKYKHKKAIPDEILRGTREVQAAFLRGLFAADGHIEKAGGSSAIALSCVNEVIVDQVRLMLLNFGIVCNKYRTENKPVPGNIYNITKSIVYYRIQFAGQFREIFIDEIGIYKEVPFVKIRHLDSEADIVVSIDDVGECEVYDLTVDDETHSFIASGVGVRNCGEQPLLPNESCNLGSINVSQFHTVDALNNPKVHWDRLKEIIPKAVRFLDDVVTINKYPVKAIEKVSVKTRKIGLGVMGWADLLLHLKTPYDSDEALHLANRLMEFVEYYALKASMKLAEERGSFPTFKHRKYVELCNSSWGGRLDWESLTQQIKAVGLRNACVTTVAPTGSLSLIAGVSSGIEPVFQWEYKYHRVEREFTEQHPLAVPYLKRGDTLPRYFVTALEIEPEWHVKMQGAFQRWVDAGISKTINLPFEATQADVCDAILMAWQRKCKGITLYRSGSREKEVLVAKEKAQLKTTGVSPRERPMFTHGSTVKIPVGDTCGTMFVTVNSDELGPCESFVMLGRGGGCISSYAEALGRMISLALRSGIDPREVIEQLSGIRCSKMRWAEGRPVRSCPDAVAYALEKVLGGRGAEDATVLEHDARSVIHTGENPECPECGMMLSIEGRCLSCRSCGYTKCS